MTLMQLVPCLPAYWEYVRLLRTDQRTAAGWIQQGPISVEQHIAFMSQHWKSYYVGLADGEPAGFVGAVNGDLRICVHPDYQRKGLARYMLEEFLARLELAGLDMPAAKIKVDNAASRALFERAGFVQRYVIYELATP